MNEQQWRSVEEHFAAAVSLPPADRFALLESIADPAIRGELASLLRANDAASSFMDTPAEDIEQPATLAVGSVVGVWRVLRLVGRGGMGEVYEVERADGQFEQRAALKLSRPEAARLFHRLAAERASLARLDHPGIARLLDGGIAPDGRPYAVMEYDDGLPNTRHCDERAADLRERLALFLQVCDAVANAHRNLVVHRDIKPGNVLVASDGRVRLLDFGIAKPLDGGVAAGEQTTGALLTPDYAAPEQLTGDPVTTATDVHGLGVLLFELLVGERPWSRRARSLAQFVGAVLDVPAPLASDAARNAPNTRTPARLLRGDLDAIIAKCLRREPQYRYPTVNALKLDIERSLRGEAVLAREDARLYVFGRFIRRYRWVATSVAAVVAALVIGLIGMHWQAERAELERDLARRAASREEAVRYHLVGLFRDAVEQPGTESVTARAMLDRSARRVIDEYKEDPELASLVVESLADLYGALGDSEAQAPLLEQFLALAEGPDGSAADPASVAAARHKLAAIEIRRGNLPRAEPLLAAAQAFWAVAPDRYREQRLEAALIRGQLERSQGRLDEAIGTFEAALGERVALSGRDHRETALLYNSLAITLAAVNRFEDALAAYREALAIYERLGRSEDPDALVMLANTGTLAFRSGRLAEAENLLKTAADKQRALSGPSAAVAAANGLYGAALALRGDFNASLPALREAIAMADEHGGRASPVALQNRLFLIEALIGAGDHGNARTLLEESLVAAAERHGAASLTTLRLELADARLAFVSGDDERAMTELPEIVEGLRSAGRPAETSLAQALALHGEVLIDAGRPREAITLLEEVVRLRERLLWNGSSELGDSRARLRAAQTAAAAPGR
jgi:eukaryotic-like serine/threonine-protein kinase